MTRPLPDPFGPALRPAARGLRLRGVLVWALLVAVACQPESREPPPAADLFPSSGTHALFRGDRNRIGGTTGGFGDALSYADVAYRLGTGVDPVADSAIDELLAAHADQVALTDAHRTALRRVLGERPAYVVWGRYFAEGGRVQDFTPPTPERLRELPPSSLVLAGEGRYIPDRLVILGKASEPAMEEFLFHEIQHYVFDRWDTALFEAGDADHQVIALLEERRRIVQDLRSGRVPMDPHLPRILHDFDGSASEALGAGRPLEAIERVTSEAFYRAWVEATVNRVEAKNESSRRVRIVTMPLSDGRTLVFDERSDREEPDALQVSNLRVPPHYRYGPVVYASVRDLGAFDEESLFSEGRVPERDREAVLEFLAAHRRDRSLGRNHVFTAAELQDLAHLSAYGAALLQAGLRLAAPLLGGSEPGLEAAMATDRYRAALSAFLRRYVDAMAGNPGRDPGAVARALVGG